MSLIKVLPQNVANQIAAGEVVQRPSSAVKELVENAIDAKATSISIFLKDAGKTQIQILDNGIGMSSDDAVIAFERHATSKISGANDLFSIHTLGFRGEALPSIASISEMSVRTRRKEDELGIQIELSANKIISKEEVTCPVGTMFTVNNLFFNLPARRKFIKSNHTELKHILNEFQRIALSRPDIELNITHNGVDIYRLPATTLPLRISHLFGNNINSQILSVNSETNVVKISGYICKPEAAKKAPGEQFFFVNKRYIRNPLLHKAVLRAFQDLIPTDSIPSYFIYFEVAPENIDINIHPTKTEVKFSDESTIFQLLVAAIKESLGKYNVIPSLDFGSGQDIDIPLYNTNNPIHVNNPNPVIDPLYNPFKSSNNSYDRSSFKDINLNQWEKLYSSFESDKIKENPDEYSDSSNIQKVLFEQSNLELLFQLNNKYIVSSSSEGLLIINQKRAHQRILFEQYIQNIAHQSFDSQQLLYPQMIDLSPADFAIFEEIADKLRDIGFDVQAFGGNTITVNSYPCSISETEVLNSFIYFFNNFKEDISTENLSEKTAKALAVSVAIPYGRRMNHEEMTYLVNQLFSCEHPSISPFGKTTYICISLNEIDRKF